jgi:outer membrane receptor for ferrienterochelin and colicin
MITERDTNFVIHRHFFSVCPSINFNWHTSETNDFSVKYAYSYKFPDIDNLTDYVDKRGVYNWNTGNPDLQSAGYHSFALGHVYSKDTYNFSTELIYKQSNNDIVSIGYYLPNNIRLIKPVNVGRTQDLGIVFTNWIRLSSKFSMTNSATLDYKNLDQSNLKKEAGAFGLEGEQFVFTQFNYNLNTYMTWSINNRNFASLRMNYYGKGLQHYGYRKPWLGSSLNYTCKLLKNDRLKLMFGIDNLTAGLIDRVAVNNNMGIYTTTLEDPSVFRRTYKVAITWIFNKGDKGTKDIKLN